MNSPKENVKKRYPDAHSVCHGYRWIIFPDKACSRYLGTSKNAYGAWRAAERAIAAQKEGK